MSGKSTLSENLKRVRGQIASAAGRVGRDPASVRLVAVTKAASPAAVRCAVELGELDLGESRVQDLQARVADISAFLSERDSGIHPTVRWHMIGHVQRNKVRPLLPMVHLIHSLDTLRLAESLDQMAARVARRVPVLLEVNCSGEPQKYGVPLGAAACLVEQLVTLPHLELRGLMTMAPQVDDPEKVRPVFARMKEVFEDVVAARQAGPRFTELSMGMSQDFQVAVEEGATLVRIGSAIFEGV